MKSVVDRRVLLLSLGALLGLSAAGTDLLSRGESRDSELPAGAVARVGGTLISAERYAQAAHDLAGDRRAPLEPADRRFVIDRLIDEELLIQRGKDLGLAESSAAIRKSLAATVIAQISAQVAAEPVSESDLRDLYQSDPDFFRTGARYRVRWQATPGSSESDRQAALRLRQKWEAGLPGTDGGRGKAPGAALVPDSLLPLAKLRDYLGADLALRIARLEPGEVAGPVPGAEAWHVVQLLEREAGTLPDFATARPLLEAEFLRRESDRALREHLLWLRRQTVVQVDWERVLQP